MLKNSYRNCTGVNVTDYDCNGSERDYIVKKVLFILVILEQNKNNPDDIQTKAQTENTLLNSTVSPSS